VVDYTDPSVIYIGTGDRDAGDAPGMGVMKSEDAGVNFAFANNGMGNVTVGCMVMHPSNHNEILAASSSGMYKTTDGGNNWVNTKSGDFKDVVYNVDDPDVVYATSGGRFYRSIDGGDSWTQITAGLSSASRGVIGVSQADAEVVYFHTVQGSEFAATYRSDDGGLTFVKKATSPNIMSWGCNGGSGGQGWYDLAIAVDPNNADILYSGGVNTWKSTNGAVSWTINTHWYGDCGKPAVHADCHVYAINPINKRLYNGNDGGIYWTEDGGNTWNEITSGLAISQIYKIGQAKTDPDKVMNGYQDNGSATYLGEETGFLTVMGGDGMDCTYDFLDDRYAYGEYYNGGSISRIFNNSNQGSISGGISESGAWVTPFALDVVDPTVMYVGMSNLWKGVDIRNFNVQWDNISDFGGSTANVVEQSEADPAIFYVASNNQSLYRTDNLYDNNPNWENLSNFLPTSGIPTDLETHPTNPDVVYMTLNYKVYKSADKGKTWENITLNLPNSSTNTIEYYKNTHDGLYVGTDAGIFYKDNDMDQWVLFSEGFPLSAATTEIEIFYSPEGPAGDMVRTSTYGRGLWSSPTYYTSPVADFVASETSVPFGCPVNFYDLSGGVPHNWEWTFEGGTPATSDEQNPMGVIYTEEGTYSVTLTVSNPLGTDTRTITSYITVIEGMTPIVNFSTYDSVFCSPGIAMLFDDSQGCPSNWLWEIEPDGYAFIDGTDANSQNPVVTFYDNEPYTVTLTATNSAGSSTLVKQDFIQAGGYQPFYVEPFNAVSFEQAGWTVENPDGYVTWELFEVGGTEPGNIAAGLDFSNYQSLGELDRLISPPFNLTGLESAWLEFEYAYAKKWDHVTDSLFVHVSSDCGITWTKVYANGDNGEGSFATHEPTENFWPEVVTDWCMEGWGARCISINLDQWKGQPGIVFAFETYSNFGNPLFIDNVAVTQYVGQEEFISDSESIKVYPNPASNQLQVTFSESSRVDEISLVNQLGQTVYKSAVLGGENSIIINRKNSWTQGIYYLKANSKSTTMTKKVILY
jgi:PKD repeat protein